VLPRFITALQPQIFPEALPTSKVFVLAKKKKKAKKAMKKKARRAVKKHVGPYGPGEPPPPPPIGTKN